MFKKIIFIFLLCFGIQLSSAQKYAFKKYTTENGLSHYFVNDIIQTKDGYIWLATYGGLVRFDGVHFRVYNSNNTPEFKVDALINLYEDHFGRLWIGSQKGLYYYYNNEIHKDSSLKSVENFYIESVFVDSNPSSNTPPVCSVG